MTVTVILCFCELRLGAGVVFLCEQRLSLCVLGPPGFVFLCVNSVSTV